MKKRHLWSVLTALVAVCICFFSFSTQVHAETVSSGTCGDHVTWTLDDAGTLTVSGTGVMDDYSNGSSPWYSLREQIKKVVVEDGVTSIGSYAFYRCDKLEQIIIGDDVTIIGTSAFRGCQALETVTIPANVTELKFNAFFNCWALTDVTFGGNAPALGDDVFDWFLTSLKLYHYEGTTGYDAAAWSDYTLQTLHVGQWIVDTEPTCTTNGSRHIDCSYCATTITETLPAAHDYVDGSCTRCDQPQPLDSGTCGANVNWQLDYFGKLTISGTGPMEEYTYSSSPWYSLKDQIKTVVIEDGVTSIGSYAFENCSNLQSVTVPDGITSIGDSAFFGCGNLTSINIPEGVTSIGEDAFYSCKSLTSVAIPESVASIGDSAFTHCNSLTSVAISEGVTSIGDFAFAYCSDLQSINIPEGVTSIGYATFSDCSSLTSITLPESVTSIDADAFAWCGNLTSITIPDSVTSIGQRAFMDCSSLTSIILPEGITSIGCDTFSNCSSLTSINIPENVTDIGEDAFSNCDSLTDVYITDPSNWCKINFENDFSNPMYYGDCIHILDTEGNEATEVVLDDLVTAIPDYAFYGCTSLVSITIPDSVTSIGKYAFFGCSNLTSTAIPEGVTSINAYTFYDCSSLASFTIGNGVSSIGDYAFDGCSSLTSLTIPDRVTSIGNYAFNRCSSLTSIAIPEGVTSIGDYAFSYCSHLTSINIPEGVTRISDHTFHSCFELTSIVIPESVTSIGNHAFTNCSNLTSIVIPKGVTSIGTYAFESCFSLTAIAIPEGVTSIGEAVFSSCFSLRSVTIPDGVTSIGDYAFYFCANLPSITIPESVTSIGDYAFYFCDLWHVLYTGTESQWQAISIGGLNNILTNATRHHEATGSEVTFDSDGMASCSLCTQPTQFTDVPEGTWYSDAVQWAVEEGITTGTGDGTTFSPDKSCTRAQVVTFLWRAAGSPEPQNMRHNFTDVTAGSYYEKAVIWAVENGITTGTGDGTTFSPDNPCTRAQVVAFLWRSAGSPTPTGTNAFIDVADGQWYTGAIIWAVEKNITSGTGDGTTFSPTNPCTRAHVVTFLYRYKNN